MSLPRYSKYKESGEKWLGAVPEHWGASPLKAIATHNDDVLDETTAPDSEIVYVDISSVDPINGITAKEAMLFSAAPSRARRRVKHGDVIISTVRTYLRAIAKVRDPEDNLVVSTGFAVVRPGSKLAPDFLGYIVSASYFVEQVIARSTGVSYPAINASELVAIPVAVPPLPEQTQIAAFLGRETTKIDALVAEQRRLMELLKEKRQAVISHAVTKGLNPDAPMKPSGIAWLGDVPEHWQAKRLKQVSMKLTDGEHISPSLSIEGVALLSAKDVRDRTIDYDVDKFVSEIDAIAFWRRCKPERGDVLVVSRGATVGRVGLVTENIEFCLMGSVILCKPMNGYSPGFLYYVLNAKHSQTSLWFSSASSAQQAIYIRDVAEVPLAVPPIEERKAIVEFLDSEVAKLDTLTTEAQRAIDLLQERRTALISAAVTGQIDVRGAVAA